ncbi:MAG: NifB/NifX family molybdenum-iron cluster-binding protein [Syntrophobacteraceae bacterium]
MKKILLTLEGNDIAPRFDLAPEVLIVSIDREGRVHKEENVVLARPSAEIVCHVAAAENIGTLICGGIEEEFLQYLKWKKVSVIHSVIGTAESALGHFLGGTLKSGDILVKKAEG